MLLLLIYRIYHKMVSYGLNPPYHMNQYDAIIHVKPLELYDYKVEKNGNKRDVNFYYGIFRDLFSFEFIDKMNLEMYNEARKFMELEQIEYNRGKER